MKNLTNYSSFFKFFYRIKSFKNHISIPLSIRWKGVTKAINTNSIESVEQFEKESYKDLCVPFYKFDSPSLFYDWALSTDEQVGGESIGTLAFNEEEKYAEVKGKLVEERNNLLQQRMYVGLACEFSSRINLKNYNGIRMQIKTDGNLYKTHITCSSDYDLLHDAYAFTIDNTNEWQTVEIPFSRFLVEKLKGQDSSKFMQNFIYDKFILKGFSIVIESEEEKQFQFQIKSIDMIYRHDFNQVLAKYKRPFFFKTQESYNQLQYLDVGDSVLELRSESNFANMQKTTVNEVMNPKEVKQFVSFKDKINQKNQNQQS
ncbi:carbohydrate-binding domain 11 protein (macronuclear) [Tetrahymena thermophila SB210]|uniref:Carbohydrate-binding domain 11 protein n=1 Tax=Tetrahymena thermophila (strain SB210) TaxID=312017 RepID=I7MMC4_TETTS|nr:carbohydrate-binding domain 11 protein [Tetrahymena thermophila SB210]EAS04582.2 carbohydrate-binding domain 11 protein [Tetrahymena thermophila SB210]|eukprot:XP_001024827.2 carbohydrate-binding domain 11 protein [Tetrahymena thermophila SB210]